MYLYLFDWSLVPSRWRCCCLSLCSSFFLLRRRKRKKERREKATERKGHRQPPPNETSFPVPFLCKSQFQHPPAQPVTPSSPIITTTTLFSSFSLNFILWLFHLLVCLFSILFWVSEAFFGKGQVFGTIGLDWIWFCALVMATSSATSNDSTATRRQTKRPKCNYVLSFMMVCCFWIFELNLWMSMFCYVNFVSVKCMLGWKGLIDFFWGSFLKGVDELYFFSCYPFWSSIYEYIRLCLSKYYPMIFFLVLVFRWEMNLIWHVWLLLLS